MASVKEAQLVYKAIAYFLKEEIERGRYSSEITESLEVAKQCIESAFNIRTDGSETVPNLRQLVSDNVETSHQKPMHPEPSEEDKNTAETLKNQGNRCMKDNKFEEAIVCYTKAIEFWPGNAVYYCNRAAAYSRMEQQNKAIEDCRMALQIDPKYSKAHGRMGVAYSSLGDYAKAAESYRKAVELDPTNENFQQNLMLAEERLKASGAAGGGAAPGSGPMGGLDLGALLNTPVIQNVVSQLMRNPNAQDLMNNLFRDSFGNSTGSAPSAGAPSANDTNADGASNTSTAGIPNIDPLFQACQQLGQQLRANNPELIDQIRQTFMGSPGSQNSQFPNGDGANAK